ncbi:MAG: S9 family peptidase [Ignavibacteriae bacterium]|nr:S9 family peptidase [Ignavibacteriota bacterium]
MKSIHKVLVILFLSISTIIPQKKNFTLDETLKSRSFFGKSLSGVQWLNSEDNFSFTKFDRKTFSQSLYKHNVKTGEESLILNAKDLVLDSLDKPIRIGYYKWSPNDKYILFTSTLHYRYSKPGGDIIIYDVKNKNLIKIAEVGTQQWVPQFSPDNKKIAFVRDDNLFVYDLLTKIENQLTFDGNGSILNGHFDWVYQEELSAVQGWKWSPDSKSIAFWQLNQEDVPEVQIAKWDSLYFNFMKFKYPKVGAKNSIVRIGLIELATSKINWMNLGEEEDIYIPKIEFTNNPNLLSVQRLNRLQNHLELLFFDVSTGELKVVINETSKGWIDVKNEPYFLKNTNQFIWASEKDGFLHFYLYDYTGKLVNQITKGKWETVKFVSVDEAKQKLYYTSNESGTIYKDFYKVNFDGTNKIKLSKLKGTNSINSGKSNYIGTNRSTSSPSITSLFSSDGKKIRDLIVNNNDAFNDYNMAFKEFVKFKTTDGVSLNAYIIKPPDFDETKKYPVLIYNYSGPGSQVVTDSRTGLWDVFLAQNGYIVFGLDNRGTGGRGTEFKHIVYKNLGHWEVNDLTEGAKYLSSLNYIDENRIGIWGWSYGAYASALAFAKSPEVFKIAVSVAPVTDWEYYDNIYTERYMSLPKYNPEGYKNSSVLEHAKNIKGKLLLMHGTGDDNVHFQNSVKLVQELVQNDIEFETMFYPESNHSMHGKNARIHLYKKMTKFIFENL